MDSVSIESRQSQLQSLITLPSLSMKPTEFDRILRSASQGSVQVEVDSNTSAKVYDDVSATTHRVTLQEASLILTVMSTPGGVEPTYDLSKEMDRSHACMRGQLTFQGEVSKDVYMKRVYCHKWWCPQCGDHLGSDGRLVVGEIHKDRRKAVFARMNGGIEVVNKESMDYFVETLKAMTQIQYVFTVPESERARFMSKDGLNRMTSSAKRILLKEYGTVGMIAYIHVMGDESMKFHPHVNVHVYLKGNVRVVPRKGPDGGQVDKQLDRIKFRWAKALKAHGCSIVQKEEIDSNGMKKFEVDVHKAFVTGREPGKMLHRIRYMTKPIMSECMEDFIKNNNEEMLKFTVMELKGFRFIRYWGALNNNNYKEWLEEIRGPGANEEIMMKANGLRTEEEQLANERLIPGGVTMVSIEELKKRPDLIVEELGRDFWRIRIKPGTALQKIILQKE